MNTVDTGDLFPYVIVVKQYGGISDTVVQTVAVIMPSGRSVEFFGPDAEKRAEKFARDSKRDDAALREAGLAAAKRRREYEAAQMAVIASGQLARDAVRYEMAAASGVQL